MNGPMRAFKQFQAMWAPFRPQQKPRESRRAAFGAPTESENAPPVAGVDLDIEALLHLRHLADRMAVSRSPPRSTSPGNIAHRRRGRGLELHDIRPWREGDDIRCLDRNVMARTGVPHVRTFREERERAVLLVADFRQSMLFGTRRALRSVAAAETLTLLGWQAVREGGRIGLMCACDHGRRVIRYGRGARAMIAMAAELGQAHHSALESRASVDPPLDAALEEAEGLAGKSGAIIVSTALDTPGPHFDGTVERIARRRDLCFVVIVDAFESAPPYGSYPYATASGGAGWLRIGRDQPKPDARIAHLQELGARAIALPSGIDVESMASKLERIHG
jgi:uncharacterized protein (DUF58 family)